MQFFGVSGNGNFYPFLSRSVGRDPAVNSFGVFFRKDASVRVVIKAYAFFHHKFSVIIDPGAEV